MQPVLGALATVSGPDAEDVAGAVHGHRHHHANGTVRHLPIADLHVHGVNEQDRVDAVEGRFCHSAMPSMTLPVMVEIVCLDTSAP